MLAVESPQARPVYRRGTGLAMAPALGASGRRRGPLARRRHLRRQTDGAAAVRSQSRIPNRPALQPGCADAVRRSSARNLASAREDIGFRNRTAVLFDIAPSRDVTLHVRDELGRPTTASFVIRDAIGRVYPARSKRLAPDFFFQNQIYRADGESVRLPAGEFTIVCGRGPEYLPETRVVTLSASTRTALDFNLRRWIDPPAQGWYSGDHHIHAAGCSHYESPTEGVRPEDMMRHVLGEALSVGAVLNWGPSYYFQRQFFEAKDNKISTASTLLRYDVEVSGFPSSHCGHLVLLRLRDQDFPETRQIEDWPSWDLPILKWAKAQNAIVGFAHSGWGLEVKTRELAELRDAEVRRDRRKRVHRGRHARRRGFHLGSGHAVRVRVEHLVSHAQLRLSDAYQRRDGLPVHLGRARRRRSLLRPPAGRPLLRCLVRGRARRAVVRIGRLQPPHGISRSTARRRAPTGASFDSDNQEPCARPRGSRACCPKSRNTRSRPTRPGSRYWTPEHARIAGSREVTVEAVVNGRPAARTRVIADGRLARRGVRHSRGPERLDRTADSRIVAHQSGVRAGRRPADSRLEAKRGMVPQGGGPVLVAEVWSHACPGARGRPARVRPRARTVPADPVRVGDVEAADLSPDYSDLRQAGTEAMSGSREVALGERYAGTSGRRRRFQRTVNPSMRAVNMPNAASAHGSGRT